MVTSEGKDVTRDGNNRDSIAQRFVKFITFRKLDGERTGVFTILHSL